MVVLSDRLNKVLDDLKMVDGVESAAIATRDGLLIAANTYPGTHPETFAAMSATILGAAEAATGHLKNGSVNRIIIESDDCRMIATGSGQKSLLVVMTAVNSGLGLILVELAKGASIIDDLLK
ncbi:MAG: roadblock/LC7 domain-containing protein [Methanosarcinaceae archaeon]|nr:roadblock/LC7 domain-containing protein [Methanosarcinaceae archaeon]